MSYSILLPSHFPSPFITTIASTRYDDRGRQLGFMESEVQRVERLAFANASKSRSSSPTLSASSSGGSTPTGRKLISEPFCDPIELMANRLAEELFGSDDFSSSSDEEYQILYSSPKQSQRAPTSSSRSSSSRKSTYSTSNPGHRRRSSLSSIPEED